MDAILTVSNLFNALVLIATFSIRNELSHIRKLIELAHKSADEAHKRIDIILAKG